MSEPEGMSEKMANALGLPVGCYLIGVEPRADGAMIRFQRDPGGPVGEKWADLRRVLSLPEEDRTPFLPSDQDPPPPGDRYHGATGVTKAARRLDLLDTAWGIISNAHGGDWDLASKDWREAAERWRDEFHSELRDERGTPLGLLGIAQEKMDRESLSDDDIRARAARSALEDARTRAWRVSEGLARHAGLELHTDAGGFPVLVAPKSYHPVRPEEAPVPGQTPSDPPDLQATASPPDYVPTYEEIAVDAIVRLGLGYLEGLAVEQIAMASNASVAWIRAKALRRAAASLQRAAAEVDKVAQEEASRAF